MSHNGALNPQAQLGPVDNEVPVARVNQRKERDQLVKISDSTLPILVRISYGYGRIHGQPFRHATYQDWQECSDIDERILTKNLNYARKGLQFINMSPDYIEEYEFKVCDTFGTQKQKLEARKLAEKKPWWNDCQNNRIPLLGSDTVE